MNERKLSVLRMERTLFHRKLRTKDQIMEMWKNDKEAVEWFRENMAKNA